MYVAIYRYMLNHLIDLEFFKLHHVVKHSTIIIVNVIMTTPASDNKAIAVGISQLASINATEDHPHKYPSRNYEAQYQVKNVVHSLSFLLNNGGLLGCPTWHYNNIGVGLLHLLKI